MNTPATFPVQITFHHLDRSDALEARIQAKVAQLGQFHPDIQHCEVQVEQLHRHHHQGRHFQVRMSLQVPGHRLQAGRDHDLDHASSDVYVALRETVQAMRRQLQDLVRHQQGQIKHHETHPHGHISEIAPDRRHGRIESVDGRSLYFHRNSLVGADLDALAVGTPVYYVEGQGDEGPQASSVTPVGKHHVLI